jgi:hypothetical protein
MAMPPPIDPLVDEVTGAVLSGADARPAAGQGEDYTEW